MANAAVGATGVLVLGAAQNPHFFSEPQTRLLATGGAMIASSFVGYLAINAFGPEEPDVVPVAEIGAALAQHVARERALGPNARPTPAVLSEALEEARDSLTGEDAAYVQRITDHLQDYFQVHVARGNLGRTCQPGVKELVEAATDPKQLVQALLSLIRDEGVVSDRRTSQVNSSISHE